MSSEMAFLKHKDLNRLAPLIKDLQAWEAFNFLLDHEEAKLLLELVRKPSVEELHRIAGKMELLKSFRSAKDRLFAMEEELRKNGIK